MWQGHSFSPGDISTREDLTPSPVESALACARK
jgi:hypothetical protein